MITIVVAAVIIAAQYLPLGVALLFAALAGLLIAAVIGGARIWQLRHAYRKAQ
jgi:uncharacterized integral membrane protein